MIPSFNRQRWILLFGDVSLILLATQISSLIRTGQLFNVLEIHTGASVFTLLLYVVMLYIFDMYNIGRAFRSADTVLRIAVAVGMAAVFSAFLFYSLPSWKYGRGILLIQILLVWGFLTGWRWLFSKMFAITIEKENVLIIGAGSAGSTLSQLLKNNVSPYQVAGYLDDDPATQGKVIGSPRVIGTTDQLMEIAAQQGVKTAILAITHDRPSKLISCVLDARLKGMNILDMPTVYESLTGRVPVKYIRDEWLLVAEGFYLLSKDFVQKIKRLIDFAVSGFLILITLPVIALTALAVRLDSAGSVFFRQKRVGKGGSIFHVWKFRTMYQNAEENGAVWAENNDHRVTRAGRWIRLFRIDELPQIYNIFRGEMSLIGPRPERPEFLRELKKKIPYYDTRHAVRPGITGWAQVNYPYGASVEDALCKLEYDLYYIKNMSILLDLKILLRTIGVVLFGEGAR